MVLCFFKTQSCTSGMLCFSFKIETPDDPRSAHLIYSAASNAAVNQSFEADGAENIEICRVGILEDLNYKNYWSPLQTCT